VNIGIVVYSQTGHTHSVAMKLKEKLTQAGHTVQYERIQPIGESGPGTRQVQLEALPDLEPYEALVFGSPVQGFSLAPAMSAYMKQLPSLQGKPVVLLVTQHLPFAFLGGNRAVGSMKKACEAQGATVRGSGIVHWSKGDLEQQITNVVEKLGGLF